MNAAPLAYIFPAVCVMKLQDERLLSVRNIPRIAVATFGILISVIGFVMAVIEMVQGVDCSHGKDMEYCHPNHTLPTTTPPS